MILQQFEIHLIKIPFQWHWWEYILLAMHVAHAHYDSVSSEMLPLGGGGGKIGVMRGGGLYGWVLSPFWAVYRSFSTTSDTHIL